MAEQTTSIETSDPDIDLSAYAWKDRLGTTWWATHRPTQIHVSASWATRVLGPEEQARQVLDMLVAKVKRATT